MLLLYSALVLCTSNALSVTIPTPSMQRKNPYESCVFQWNINGNFTTYAIKMLSTGSPTALRPNTNHTFDSRKNVVKLFIWNIQLPDAGFYSLSISTANSPEVNSVAVLFVYGYPSAFVTLAVGRNPAFEGDMIELNCAAVSTSLPADFRPKMNYYWYNRFYGFLRNISSGPAVLENGDALPGYSIKNDGKSLVVASAKYTENNFYCHCQEDGSPHRRNSPASNFPVYSKPYADYFNPANNRICSTPLSLYVACSFTFFANPPLTSYTNWSFMNASHTTELPLNINSSDYGSVTLHFQLSSSNSYGNYSVTLTNSNGSITETFRVLPPGPPDAPSNFNVQYMTHSLVSLHWRCMWYNGDQQAVLVRLMDVKNNYEVETQIVSLPSGCYNESYVTLFQSNIQPETDYKASISSINTFGSSSVVNLAFRTPKRIIFDTSSASISITGKLATINFFIADSTRAIMWLNVTCCVEITTQCNNKSYIINNTDNQIVYDILPNGFEYVFDFNLYDTDGYTYMYTLAIVKGVRVSLLQESTADSPTSVTISPCTEKTNGLLVAVMVLAILLGFATLGLIGSLIALLVYKRRQKHQPSKTYQPLPSGLTRPYNANGFNTTTSGYDRDSNYEQIPHLSIDSSSYTPLYALAHRADVRY